MTINPLFGRKFNQVNEQELLQGLVTESIQIYGENMMYCPRNIVNMDKMYGADDLSTFTLALPIEIYIKSAEGFGGNGAFMSRFNLEIRDQITFTISRRAFETEIQRYTELIRPREGDLIYFPLNQKLFEIMYVNYKPDFYPLGALPMFDLACELYEYSNETFKTGVPEIDAIQKLYTKDILDFGVEANTSNGLIVNEDDDYIVFDPTNELTDAPDADNDAVKEQAQEIIDYSESDPFSQNRILINV